MIHLDVDDLLHIAQRLLGNVEVRDIGLLQSAAARPMTTAFEADAYPTFAEKAAALVHSIARNHALVDGNKRLALAALLAYAGMNGFRFTATNEEAYDLIMAVAAGELDDVASIALRIAASLVPRRP